MILQTKNEILNWLEIYDREYLNNIEKNAYELINIHDHSNQTLFNEMISKDNLLNNYLEKLKSEGHQYIVNIKGDVNICNQKLEKIPFQFYHVDGDFDYSDNNLISLKGSPLYVGRNFYCCYNQLKSLEYCPQFIVHNFDCSNNLLTSLEYFPGIVKQGVYLDHNTQLLKYKKESHDKHINNMTDNDFFNQRDFKFWQQFHLQENFQKQNNQLINDLELNDTIKKHHANKPTIKKV